MAKNDDKLDNKIKRLLKESEEHRVVLRDQMEQIESQKLKLAQQMARTNELIETQLAIQETEAEQENRKGLLNTNELASRKQEIEDLKDRLHKRRKKQE